MIPGLDKIGILDMSKYLKTAATNNVGYYPSNQGTHWHVSGSAKYSDL